MHPKTRNGFKFLGRIALMFWRLRIGKLSIALIALGAVSWHFSYPWNYSPFSTIPIPGGHPLKFEFQIKTNNGLLNASRIIRCHREICLSASCLGSQIWTQNIFNISLKENSGGTIILDFPGNSCNLLNKKQDVRINKPYFHMSWVDNLNNPSTIETFSEHAVKIILACGTRNNNRIQDFVWRHVESPNYTWEYSDNSHFYLMNFFRDVSIDEINIFYKPRGKKYSDFFYFSPHAIAIPRKIWRESKTILDTIKNRNNTFSFNIKRGEFWKLDEEHRKVMSKLPHSRPSIDCSRLFVSYPLVNIGNNKWSIDTNAPEVHRRHAINNNKLQINSLGYYQFRKDFQVQNIEVDGKLFSLSSIQKLEPERIFLIYDHKNKELYKITAPFVRKIRMPVS